MNDFENARHENLLKAIQAQGERTRELERLREENARLRKAAENAHAFRLVSQRLVDEREAALVRAEAENARLREALVEAALPLEVLVASDANEPYPELGPDLRENLRRALERVRAALGVSVR